MSPTLSVVERYPVRDGAPTSQPSVNDLAIRVGTVNGSGSQSANLVLLRALHGMGIPCSGKNVFPSNIEGLPTWFHIRASARGYVGHRLDTSILVCMNAQTAADDVRQLKPGSIVISRDDIDLDDVRDDVRLFPVPFQKLAERAFPPYPKDKGYRDKLR
ncbi:MAG: 2-oxoacid:acceptor oxidoreductase family protein, partial [Planctomycetaceae bacterium]|nr:2-oxoacid:acceptor oxidoreductase family protein [Planctomycetaceae bacterium]